MFLCSGCLGFFQKIRNTVFPRPSWRVIKICSSSSWMSSCTTCLIRKSDTVMSPVYELDWFACDRYQSLPAPHQQILEIIFLSERSKRGFPSCCTFIITFRFIHFFFFQILCADLRSASIHSEIFILYFPIEYQLVHQYCFQISGEVNLVVGTEDKFWKKKVHACN